MERKNVIEFIIKTIKGMIVGLGVITAGAGTFAIVLGIYDRCMEIIANPFKGFKDNLKYLAPILLGIGISVLIFKNIVGMLFTSYESYVKCVFFGIILGGLPSLFKIANKKNNDNKHWLAFAVAYTLTILATVKGNAFNNSMPDAAKIDFFLLMIYGAIYGFGAIVPGMTTMHILIFLGVWGTILEGVLKLNMSIIIPFVIGYITVVILTAKIMSFCFEKFYGYTYYAIIGFSATSLIMLIPSINSIQEKIICPIIIVISTLGMYKISKLEDKIKERESRIYS